MITTTTEAPETAVASSEAPPGRHQLISKEEMLKKVGRAWPTVWSWICQGKFPQPVRTDPDSVAVMWVLAEIDAWIENLMASARKAYPSKDTNIGNAKHENKRRNKKRAATKPAPAQ